MAEPGLSQIQSGSKPDGMPWLFPASKLAAEIQNENDEATAKRIWALWGKSKEDRKPYDRHDGRFWDLWESNHWQSRISHTLTRAVINYVHSIVETFVGHVLDGITDPIVRGRIPDHRAKAKLASKWLKYEWDANDCAQELEHSVRSAAVTGRGWINVEWDESRLSNKGDVAILPVDEKHIWISPHARTLEEALYLIDARNVPRDFVERNWELGSAVPPGPWDGTITNTRAYQGSDDKDVGAWQEFKTTDSKYTNVSLEKSGRGRKERDLVTLVKAYIRQEDATMRLTIVANGIVLQDGPGPYDDDDFPYVPVVVLPVMGSIYGRSLVQFIEGLQEILNHSMSYLLDQQRYASDPMLIVDQVNLEDGQLIDNSPGAVLPNANPNGQGYQWLTAPGFNQAWLEIQRVTSEYMDSVLGRVDVLRGEKPPGVTTLGGLEIIRDQANVRLRKLTEHFKKALKRVYKLTLSRLRQFARDQRTLRIIGKGGVEEFVTVNPPGGVSAEGQVIPDITIPEDAEMDVEFGKDVPGGRQARIELALALAGTPAEDGLPMVDRQYVLEQAEIEEAPEVIQRLGQMAEMQAKAQQATEGGGEAEEPPPQDQIMELFTRSA